MLTLTLSNLHFVVNNLLFLLSLMSFNIKLNKTPKFTTLSILFSSPMCSTDLTFKINSVAPEVCFPVLTVDVRQMQSQLH